jgi:hypothetical protein
MQDHMAECSLEALRRWEVANAASTDATSSAGVAGEGAGGQNEVLEELGRMRSVLHGAWGRPVRPADPSRLAKYADTLENQVQEES